MRILSPKKANLPKTSFASLYSSPYCHAIYFKETSLQHISNFSQRAVLTFYLATMSSNHEARPNLAVSTTGINTVFPALIPTFLDRFAAMRFSSLITQIQSLIQRQRPLIPPATALKAPNPFTIVLQIYG